MLPVPYGSFDRDQLLIRVPFTFFIVVTVCLPLVGFVSCITVSLFYHFSEATNTHCQVSNYLPSISAALSLTPERYIWRFCIGLHSAPRFLVAAAYFSFYRRWFSKKLVKQLLNIFTLLCALSENVGLLLLTYVCSAETYSLHKTGFIMFIVSSLLHMLFTCGLWQVIPKRNLSSEEVTSSRYKNRLFLFNIGCCTIAGYFYWRHNKYCEPGIYTLFALFEYLVVLSNMAFHMTAFLDFGNKEIMVTTPPEGKHN
ncbi:post-GPI attachment to proteins factor 2 isoform X1 [Electrophorus electricus]|uniref:Acyltransferase PGAP2 n=1 Tax=Electrophorus electricus TaxID=8005 RepID=A0A4W4EJC1_ELEEL|nr:post-GPI attachment to proteins factor 2 isoform X1 [Electrophorus electricus]